MNSFSNVVIKDDESGLNQNSQQVFWDEVRAGKYNHLKWVHDQAYMNALIQFSELSKEHLVLDLGTGTGVVAQAIAPCVSEVIALDISENMIRQAPKVPHVSFVRWNAKDLLFASNLFHRIISRMAFHNFGSDCEKILSNCYEILKPGGQLVIAEGVPPDNAEDVVQWYATMFKMKEERLVFTFQIFENMFLKAGFQNIKFQYHYFDDFDVTNWLENSGLSSDVQAEIIKVHLNMPDRLKQLYKLREEGSQIFIRTRNLLISGTK